MNEPPDKSAPMHTLLKRQLRRLKLDQDTPPSPEQWKELLDRINRVYQQHDEDRYLLERSLEVSSEEMRQMYDLLKEKSDTELQKKAEQLSQLNIELQQARDAAIQANHTKSTFLAHMSHELRTPLSGIIGYAELILEDLNEMDDAELASTPNFCLEDVQHIHHASINLLHMINTLLDLSKIEAGQVEIVRKNVSTSKLSQELHYTLSPLLSQKPNLSYQENLGENIVLHEDVIKLKQILINLLSNAIKYTKQGSITLELKPSDSHFVWHVHDTGEGISEEQQLQIFESFHRLEHHHDYTGTGLGLHITQQLTHALDGTIEVSSTLHKGTTFTVTLPRHPLPEDIT